MLQKDADPSIQKETRPSLFGLPAKNGPTVSPNPTLYRAQAVAYLRTTVARGIQWICSC